VDPNEALDIIRDVMEKLRTAIDENEEEDFILSFQEVAELSEMVDVWEGLDNWMKGGGFLPHDWNPRRRGGVR